MTSRDLKTWASAYIEARGGAQTIDEHHELWWAIEWPMGIVAGLTPPDELWRGILEVLKRDPPDAVLGMLAAGPLEDLIHCHGVEFIDLIEVEAAHNPAFRHLLGGVWESGTPDVWRRVEGARGSEW